MVRASSAWPCAFPSRGSTARMNGDGWSRSDAKDERPSLVKGAEPRSTAHLVGRRALVIGAGIGGLAAAGALARHFEHVLVLEGDNLPGPTKWRAGVPQGRHAHGLLTGGERALVDLFPGFDHDIERSGAVRVRAGLDVRVERPGFDPYPRRDLGWDLWSLSRAHLEFTLRQRVRALRNVELREGRWVKELTTGAGGAVTGARCGRAPFLWRSSPDPPPSTRHPAGPPGSARPPAAARRRPSPAATTG